jgi:hypothetical protein
VTSILGGPYSNNNLRDLDEVGYGYNYNEKLPLTSQQLNMRFATTLNVKGYVGVITC